MRSCCGKPGYLTQHYETLEEITLEGRKMFTDLMVDHTSGWISDALEKLSATTSSR